MIKSEILEEGLSLKVFQKEVLESYTQTLDAFTVALQKIRISRAHPSLLEHIKVMAYGSPTNLKDIAIIAASDTLTLTVEPFDKGLLSSIEATLSQAEHALNPKNNKNKLIINLPPMSQERRRELTKETKKKKDEFINQARIVRQNIGNEIKTAEKKKSLSKDKSAIFQKEAQHIFEKISSEIEIIADKKEKQVNG